jgi:hypothetical protein
MNKFFTIAIAAIFVLAGSAITYAQSGTNFNGIKVSASGGITFVGSHLSNGYSLHDGKAAGNNDTAGVWLNKDASDRDQTEYQINLNFEKEFLSGGSAFLKIRAGSQDSAAVTIGRFKSAVNDDNAGGGNNDNYIFVNEINFTQPIVKDLFSIKVGKFGDVGSPNDAASSVGSFFQGDATIPGVQGNWTNPYGVQVDFSPISLITVQYQYLTQAYTDSVNPNESSRIDNPYIISKSPYNVLWVNFKPIEKGNYRIGYWRDTAERDLLTYREYSENGNTYRYRPDGGGAEPHGIFLSFDQEVISNVSLFVRGGYRLDKTIGSGIGQAGNSWQFGTKIGGSFWGRANDSFFIAVGQASYQENSILYSGEDYKIEDYRYNSNYLKPKPETHLEVNYSIAVNDFVSFILFGQYVGDIYYYPDWEGPDDSRDYISTSKDSGYGYAGGLKLVLNF